MKSSVKMAQPPDAAESLGQGPLLAFPSLALQCACCLCMRVSAHGAAEALGCYCVVSAVERATFDVVLGHMAGPSGTCWTTPSSVLGVSRLSRLICLPRHSSIIA